MAEFDVQVSLTRAVRRFFEVIRLEKKEVSAIYFITILSGLIQLSLPLGIQAIINFAQIAAGRTILPASMWLLIALVVTGVLLTGILQVSQMRIVEKIQQRIFSRYAFEFTHRIPKIDLAQVEGYHLPEVVNRFFDSVTLQKSLAKILLEIPIAIIQVLFGLILLSFYNPVFVLMGLLLLFVLYLTLQSTAKRGLEASIRESNFKYDIASWIQELARAFKSFKISARENLHLKKTDSMLEGYLQARTDHFMVLKTQYWSLVVFKLLITASMLIIGSLLLMSQQLNIGQFIAAEIVILMVLAAVEKMIISLDKVYDVLTSLEKLSKVTEKNLEENGVAQLKKNEKGMSISMRNLSFSFQQNRQILSSINLDIPAGAKVCIMGEAGSGKSVLLELMTGSLNQFQGKLLFEGIPLGNYDIDSLRQQTGVFYHEQDIFKGTIMENITMGGEKVDLTQLLVLAEAVGLKEFITSQAAGFETILQSTGQGLSTIIAKKILLMRAFAFSPSLLLLDEPFELAGAEHSKSIMQLILEQKNTTAVVATGNKDFALHCDMVVLLEKGKIVSVGKPVDVINTNNGS
jgi:ABC-type bacteriocin/lantibiotic exporter with double-glycine peptidase domain